MLTLCPPPFRSQLSSPARAPASEQPQLLCARRLLQGLHPAGVGHPTAPHEAHNAEGAYGLVARPAQAHRCRVRQQRRVRGRRGVVWRNQRRGLTSADKWSVCSTHTLTPHDAWDERFAHPARTWASALHRSFTLQATGVARANIRRHRRCLTTPSGSMFNQASTRGNAGKQSSTIFSIKHQHQPFVCASGPLSLSLYRHCHRSHFI